MKYCYKNVHVIALTSIIYHSQKVETNQMSTNVRMKKQIMYIYIEGMQHWHMLQDRCNLEALG
jgi:hypothetical protein